MSEFNKLRIALSIRAIVPKQGIKSIVLVQSTIKKDHERPLWLILNWFLQKLDKKFGPKPGTIDETGYHQIRRYQNTSMTLTTGITQHYQLWALFVWDTFKCEEGWFLALLDFSMSL